MHAVMFGVARFKTAQHQAGCVIIGLINLDHLEATLQSSVTFEILLVFTPGSGGDGTQFATRQRRFQQISRICPASLITRPDNGVRLINKQQHRYRGLLYRIDDIFQTLFKFPLHTGTCLKQTQIKCPDDDRLKTFGHIALGNT